ncbi:MAG TPA: hypothetical protein VLE73_05020 [Candidatus Saccharimonadales bacterium]|nr:hypothetical protein [Candidatus Saccharimonadales bacterium]
MNAVKQIVLSVAALIAFAGLVSLAMPATPAFAALPPAPSGPTPAPATGPQVCSNGTGACATFIQKYINPFIKLLTAIVGVGAALSIIIAGIQYSQSADDPSAVSKAKMRIVQTLIGVLGYLFLFAFLNYVVPGGLI